MCNVLVIFNKLSAASSARLASNRTNHNNNNHNNNNPIPLCATIGSDSRESDVIDVCASEQSYLSKTMCNVSTLSSLLRCSLGRLFTCTF